MWRCTGSSWIPFLRSGEGGQVQAEVPSPAAPSSHSSPRMGHGSGRSGGLRSFPLRLHQLPPVPQTGMFILDREPHSHQPHQEQWDGRSWLGPGQAWAGAGAPQGLPQRPEVGSVPETSNFQGSICWAWDGEFYPMPK